MRLDGNDTGLAHRVARIDRQPELTRSFGLASLLALGVGTVVGAGIMVIVGRAAADFAGPALPISLLIATAVAGLVALSYMQLASIISVSGGSYTYAHTVLGPSAGWVVGLGMGLEYMLAAPVLAVGFAAYFDDLLAEIGIHVPDVLGGSLFESAGGGIDLPATLIVLLLGTLLVLGTRESARVATVVVAIKVGALVIFVAVGSAFVDTANWEPFIPAREGGSFGVIGIIQAAAIVFFSFLGFDVVATAGRETKRPRRIVPMALAGTLLIAAALYVGVGMVMTGLRSFRDLGVGDPLSAALEPFSELEWLQVVIELAAVIGLPVGVMASLLALSRMSMRLGADGALPSRLGRVDRRSGLPRTATIAVTVVVAVLAGFAPLDTLASAVSAGTLVAFIAVSVAAIRLGRRAAAIGLDPGLRLSPVVPGLAIVACLGLLAILPLETKIIAGTWFAAGLALWFLVLRRHAVQVVEGDEGQPVS